MNHGVSESLEYSMNLRKSVPYSILNVGIRVHHLNSVMNQLTSREIVSHLLLDLLRYHLNQESLSMRRLNMEVRRLPIVRAKSALNNSTLSSSRCIVNRNG